MKYVSRPKSTGVKDIDDISIFWGSNIDVVSISENATSAHLQSAQYNSTYVTGYNVVVANSSRRIRVATRSLRRRTPKTKTSSTERLQSQTTILPPTTNRTRANSTPITRLTRRIDNIFRTNSGYSTIRPITADG